MVGVCVCVGGVAEKGKGLGKRDKKEIRKKRERKRSGVGRRGRER